MRRATSFPLRGVSHPLPSVPEARSISTSAQRPPSFEAVVAVAAAVAAAAAEAPAAAVAVARKPAELRARHELIMSSIRDHGMIVLIAIGAV